ncbi:MAG: hypothetical protein AAGF77_01505 [Bacteroidota bacterium]
MSTIKQTSSLTPIFLRLERSQQCVSRLLKNLRSYKYEPKDYSLYVDLELLRTGLSKLQEDQRHLFVTLQQHKLDLQKASQKVDELLVRFGALEKDIAAYLLKTGNY